VDTLKKIWLAVDEKVFALLFLLATVAAAYYFAPESGATVAEIVVLKMIYVSVLLVVSLGLLFFLRGTKYDIYAEIFDQHNIAAAILIAALLLAVANVIGK
jgi:hypothetical protein